MTEEIKREILRLVDAGENITAIGKRASVSPSVLSRFLKGQRSITATTCEKLMTALNLKAIKQ